jgi:hypothetical protein
LRDFDQHRTTYYADLNQPLSADAFVASLQTQLTTALASFERFMAKKPNDVAIGKKRGKGWITLSPLPAQPEPKHLPRLKTEIVRRWGITDLLDMFKESALLTECLDCFLSTGSRESLTPDLLQKHLLLCIYGMGTNIGLKRLAGVDPNIDAEHLRYTRRRYLHKDHFRAAIAQVVNALLHARQEAIWGEATSTCASDSKKFHKAFWTQHDDNMGLPCLKLRPSHPCLTSDILADQLARPDGTGVRPHMRIATHHDLAKRTVARLRLAFFNSNTKARS